MIYHQPGEEFWHEGVCYKVGGRIVANEASDYAGLFGNMLPMKRAITQGSSEISLKFAPRMTERRTTTRRTSTARLTRRYSLRTALRWSRPFHSFTMSRNTSRIWAWIWSLWGLK